MMRDTQKEFLNDLFELNLKQFRTTIILEGAGARL